MAYTKQNWIRGDVITAEKLNHMEDGIASGGSGGGSGFVINGTVKAGPTVYDVVTFDKSFNDVLEAQNEHVYPISVVFRYGSSAQVFMHDTVLEVRADGQKGLEFTKTLFRLPSDTSVFTGNVMVVDNEDDEPMTAVLSTGQFVESSSAILDLFILPDGDNAPVLAKKDTVEAITAGDLNGFVVYMGVTPRVSSSDYKIIGTVVSIESADNYVRSISIMFTTMGSGSAPTTEIQTYCAENASSPLVLYTQTQNQD